MSEDLQARAKAFLKKPVPKDVSYVPGSMAENFIAAYAKGKLEGDEELSEMLGLCIMESEATADQSAGEAAAYFRESAAILQGIQDEMET